MSSGNEISNVSLGEPLSLVPLGYYAVLAAFSLVAITVGLFLWQGQFPRKVTLLGAVESSTGQYLVYAAKEGYISDLLVTEKMVVTKGQPLFEVKTEVKTKSGFSASDTQQRLAKVVATLREDLLRLTKAHDNEQRQLVKQSSFLRGQVAELDEQIRLQQLAANTLNKMVVGQRPLLAQKYISEAQLQATEREYTAALISLSELKYTRISLSREAQEIDERLATMALDYENSRAQIERTIADNEQRLQEAELREETVVLAPQDGVVTALSVKIGESVSLGSLALILIPKDVSWDVTVYASSRDIGFIRENSTAKIRYDAFPYQRFGLYSGQVSVVSRAAVKGSMLDSRLIPNEYYYKVKITLDDQCIKAYGKCEPLQAGMGLMATITTGQRTLIEWALDPLYTITGKI